MSITPRGPKNVLVIDRVVLPINEVADNVCVGRPINDIMESYRITEEEVFEAIQAWVDIRDATTKDYIELKVSNVDNDFSVVTTGITDWIFLNIITVGRTHHPDIINNDKLYTLGLEHIITDCCYDVKNDNDGWEISDLHRIVFLEFNRHIPVNIDTVDQVLENIMSSKVF